MLSLAMGFRQCVIAASAADAGAGFSVYGVVRPRNRNVISAVTDALPTIIRDNNLKFPTISTVRYDAPCMKRIYPKTP